MSFSVGIIGLPNAGKSTLFKALTKRKIEIGPRPFTTIHPNIGIVQVPDQRLNKIGEAIKSEKITATTIEFIDIAGLIKNAYKGEGLGNQFLAQIRNCHALLEIVRVFKDEKVEHLEKELNPGKDIDIIKTELLMKDLETIEKVLSKLKKKEKENEKKIETLQRLKEDVAKGNRISEISLSPEEEREIREYQFFTQKPRMLIFNLGEKNVPFEEGLSSMKINLKSEEEKSELSEKEIRELELETILPQVILNCYKMLGLITFYTIARGKEARAWTLPQGSQVTTAGRIVHSDFEKFIRAEVIGWKRLIEQKNWQKAKEKGLLKTVSRNYIIQDGDVIEFKI